MAPSSDACWTATEGDQSAAHLRNFGLLPGGGPPEMVKADVKPLVDLGVDLVVLVTDLLGRDAFL